MPQTLALPWTPKRGRLSTIADAEVTRQIVLLCCGDNDSTNPFNTDVGISPPVFALLTSDTGALIRLRIEKHFQRLEAQGFARLDDLQISDADPERRVHLLYTDLEAEEPREMDFTIGASDGGQ